MKKKGTEDVKKMELTMEEEIKKRKKIPDDVKKQRNKNIFRNLIFAVGITIYFILLNLGYHFIEKTIFTRDTVVFSFAALIVVIILFERAYRSEKGYYAVHGIEVLVASIFTYFVPYTYFNFDVTVTKILMASPIAFVVYYCIKAIVIGIKANKKKENDIKNIIKNEEMKKDYTWDTVDKDLEEEIDLKDDEEKITTKKTTRPVKTAKTDNAKKNNKTTTSKTAKTSKKSDSKKTTKAKTDLKEDKKSTKSKLTKTDKDSKQTKKRTTTTKAKSETKKKTNIKE